MIEARIVGVIRSPWFSDYGDLGPRHASCPRRASSPSTARSSSGRWGSATSTRSSGSKAAATRVPEFREELAEVTGRRDIEFFDLVGDARHVHDVARFEADALLVFAAAAGIAALFLVGQSIVRYVAAATAELGVLRSVGMRPRHVRTMAAVGPTLAAVVGGAVGAFGAYLVSDRFPVGTAAPFEPSPGRQADVTVLVGRLHAGRGARGGGCPHRIVAGGSDLRPRLERAGPRAWRRSPGASAPRCRWPSGPASRSSAGAGRSRCPCCRPSSARWSAWWASSAALTFADGVDDATSHPERFGMYAELETFVGFNGNDFVPADDLITALAAVDGVAAVNDNRSGCRRGRIRRRHDVLARSASATHRRSS